MPSLALSRLPASVVLFGRPWPQPDKLLTEKEHRARSQSDVGIWRVITLHRIETNLISLLQSSNVGALCREAEGRENKSKSRNY
jgi:hypothetical protein